MRSLRLFPLLLLSVAVQACVPKAVIWDEAVQRLPGALADTMRLAWPDTAALPVLVSAWTPATWPAEPGTCTASLRAARALDGEAFASWFAVRPDSSVLLRVARSDDDGATWNPAVTADSTDVGTAGCARPAPFIAADSLNAYVHVVYHLVAREGAGLFFTHTMERGALFHEPVPIVYGDRPSAAAVASRGDTVVVVYEDPNSRSARLGLAISRTQGHIFERRVPASDETGEAHLPRIAVRGTRVAIAWTVTQRGNGAQRTAVRLGTLAW
ncbi:MAG TPA: hypothetical protein VFM71_07200 [Gemmatimonadaceae bacterium]|nr:hypothetical protein [Gemmatimonadaceae bacterium]